MREAHGVHSSNTVFELPGRPYPGAMKASRKIATAAVLLGLVISAFEGTVVTTAMPTIANALGVGTLYAWVFTAFLLASTLGVMLSGKLGDQLGRKPTFLGGVFLFLAGSALCGAAHSLPWLIAFRVVLSGKLGDQLGRKPTF